jgi:dihydrofolate synthase/folylpolyglutamate synthase
MTYQQTLEYLYEQLPMFTRIGAAAYKEDLDNTIALCEALDNPQHKFKSIHIAGTNGKGSTSHMLAAMLQKAGYKTGLYTSPHIRDFGERIRINGEMIDETFVVNFVENTQQLAHDIQPSFFELTVAMAFDYFAKEKVDIAVIETGLGGRLDSTNVITPLLSVITNIGMDHVHLLGNTLEKIAGEKAGIIKQGVPVVIGEYLPETRPVFEAKATAMQAPIHFAEELYEITHLKEAGKSGYNVSDKTNGHTEQFELDLHGLYQLKNLRTVLAAEKILHDTGFPISGTDEKYALANVKKLTGLRGRWDILEGSPVVIQDVGHNEDGIRMIVQQLSQDYPGAKLHFVLGFVKDKDVTHVLDLFPKDAAYYFTNAHIPRALSAKELQEMAESKSLKGNAFDDVNEAIAAAKKNAGAKDVIMICGSFFIIAEVK